jgi:hypothetical protein
LGLLNGFIDQLKHHSEIQVITALSLTSTIHKSPQRSLSPFPACVFASRCQETASNSGDSLASRPQVLASPPPVLN